MPKVSINLNETQYHELEQAALSAQQSLTNFIISKLPISSIDNVLTIELIKEKLKNKTIIEFTIPQLFTTERWSLFTKGSKLSTAKTFNKIIINNGISNISYLGKNSKNLATYKKIL